MNCQFKQFLSSFTAVSCISVSIYNRLKDFIFGSSKFELTGILYHCKVLSYNMLWACLVIHLNMQTQWLPWEINICIIVEVGNSVNICMFQIKNYKPWSSCWYCHRLLYSYAVTLHNVPRYSEDNIHVYH